MPAFPLTSQRIPCQISRWKRTSEPRCFQRWPSKAHLRHLAGRGARSAGARGAAFPCASGNEAFSSKGRWLSARPRFRQAITPVHLQLGRARTPRGCPPQPRRPAPRREGAAVPAGRPACGARSDRLPGRAARRPPRPGAPVSRTCSFWAISAPARPERVRGVVSWGCLSRTSNSGEQLRRSVGLLWAPRLWRATPPFQDPVCVSFPHGALTHRPRRCPHRHLAVPAPPGGRGLVQPRPTLLTPPGSLRPPILIRALSLFVTSLLARYQANRALLLADWPLHPSAPRAATRPAHAGVQAQAIRPSVRPSTERTAPDFPSRPGPVSGGGDAE